MVRKKLESQKISTTIQQESSSWPGGNKNKTNKTKQRGKVCFYLVIVVVIDVLLLKTKREKKKKENIKSSCIHFLKLLIYLMIF